MPAFEVGSRTYFTLRVSVVPGIGQVEFAGMERDEQAHNYRWGGLGQAGSEDRRGAKTVLGHVEVRDYETENMQWR